MQAALVFGLLLAGCAAALRWDAPRHTLERASVPPSLLEEAEHKTKLCGNNTMCPIGMPGGGVCCPGNKFCCADQCALVKDQHGNDVYECRFSDEIEREIMRQQTLRKERELIQHVRNWVNHRRQVDPTVLQIKKAVEHLTGKHVHIVGHHVHHSLKTDEAKKHAKGAAKGTAKGAAKGTAKGAKTQSKSVLPKAVKDAQKAKAQTKAKANAKAAGHDAKVGKQAAKAKAGAKQVPTQKKTAASKGKSTNSTKAAKPVGHANHTHANITKFVNGTVNPADMVKMLAKLVHREKKFRAHSRKVVSALRHYAGHLAPQPHLPVVLRLNRNDTKLMKNHTKNNTKGLEDDTLIVKGHKAPVGKEQNLDDDIPKTNDAPVRKQKPRHEPPAPKTRPKLHRERPQTRPKTNKTKKEKKDPNAIELNKKGGFKAYGHGYPIPHVVHEDGLCMLSGVATLGSGKLGTLPHKCWPKTGGVILPVLIHRKTADLTGHVEIDSNGKIYLVTPPGAGGGKHTKGAYVSLCGLVYPVKPSNDLKVELAPHWKNKGQGKRSVGVTEVDGLCVMSGTIRGGAWGVMGGLPKECPLPEEKRIFFSGVNGENTIRVDLLESKGHVVFETNHRKKHRSDWVSMDGVVFAAAGGKKHERVRRLPLRKGWKNAGDEYRKASYKRVNNIVLLSGAVYPSDSKTEAKPLVAVLPRDYRPETKLVFGTNHGRFNTRIEVDTKGRVYFRSKDFELKGGDAHDGDRFLNLNGVQFALHEGKSSNPGRYRKKHEDGEHQEHHSASREHHDDHERPHKTVKNSSQRRFHRKIHKHVSRRRRRRTNRIGKSYKGKAKTVKHKSGGSSKHKSKSKSKSKSSSSKARR